MLVKVAKKNKVSIFRGEEDDIIKRYFDCAKEYKLDLIISVNGDNPLTSVEHIEYSVEKALSIDSNKKFIITQKKLPLGCASYIFNSHTLQTVFNSYITKKNDTGFIYFFTKTKLCKVIYNKEDKKLLDFKDFVVGLENTTFSNTISSSKAITDIFASTPAAAAGSSTHGLALTINGVNYNIMLSATA